MCPLFSNAEVRLYALGEARCLNIEAERWHDIQK